MNCENLIAFSLLCGLSASAVAQGVIRNDRYAFALAVDRSRNKTFAQRWIIP